MGILSRAVRLCKADLHGVMDQMEDKDLLLRQHLREMQAAMAGRQARIDQLQETLRAGQRDRAIHEKQLRALEDDLDAAVARDRDDIARMLIRKMLPLRKGLESMARRLNEVAERLAEEQDRLGVQRLAYDDTRHRVAAARQRFRCSEGQTDLASLEAGLHQAGASEEEIEWELLQRKEAAGSGRTT
jgi:phage shock protein A